MINIPQKIKGKWLFNEKMAKYTSWRVGGAAEKMYLPRDKEDLIAFMATLPKNTAVFWLGLGSNLLVREGGVAGVTINVRGRLKKIHPLDNNCVYVEAGVPCARVARFCVDQGLTGAEFLAGIPGTMGGALKMNAGAFGGETWSIVKQVEMLHRDGRVYSRIADDFKIGYRSVNVKNDEWFLSVVLTLRPAQTSNGLQSIKDLLEARAITQPTHLPSCGSVFKNPPHDYAARLIEASHLKGYRIGGACVSEKHANFIVNTDQATAKDIEALINYVQQQVHIQQNVYLETEVCRIGVC